jgi:hypothetical protein
MTDDITRTDTDASAEVPAHAVEAGRGDCSARPQAPTGEVVCMITAVPRSRARGNAMIDDIASTETGAGDARQRGPDDTLIKEVK